MEIREVLGKYNEYFEPIRVLSNIPLWETPTLDKLDLKRAMTVSIYRSMKTLPEQAFELPLVDYLCWLCLQYLTHMAKMAGKNLEDFIVEKRQEFPVETTAVLRLLHKNPAYIFGPDDLERSKKLYELWYQLFYQQLGESSGG